MYRNMKIQDFLKVFIFIAVCGENLQAYNVSSMFKRNSSCECGTRNDFVPRIIGGRSAEPHKHPWMALILVLEDPQCGGALINNRYILTAGHCTVGFQIETYSVALGVHDIKRIKDATIKKVDSIFLHEDYASDDIHDTNDMSLIKLKDLVEFTPEIQPICLPESDEDYSDAVATILGWGKIHEDGDAANVLKIANIKVLTKKECMKNKLVAAHLTDSVLCGYRDNADACQGDSGGPLILKNEKGYFEEIGVISWGIGCGRSGMPGIYTKTFAYLEWIALHTRDSEYCVKPDTD